MTLPGVSASPQFFSIAQLLGLISGQLLEGLHSLSSQLCSLPHCSVSRCGLHITVQRRGESCICICTCPWECPHGAPAGKVACLQLPLLSFFLLPAWTQRRKFLGSSGKLFSVLNHFFSWTRNVMSYQPSHFFLHEHAACLIDTVSSSSA